MLFSRRGFATTSLGVAGSVLLPSSLALAKNQPTAKPETVGMSSAGLAELDAKMQSFVASGRRAGIVTLVSRRGRIVHHKAFGWANIATKKPMRTDAVMRMASMTKPITCVASMMLCEQGKIDLDDPVEKYIPEFATTKIFVSRDPYGEMYLEPPKRKPTIRDLFRHTAGLTYGDFRDQKLRERWAKEDIMALSQADFIKALATYPLDYQPGEKWFYSCAIDVLGYIVESLSGMSLPEFCRTRIFEPLDMPSTAIGPAPDKLKDRIPVLYNKDSTAVLDELGAKYGRGVVGGSGLWSTARDYNQFSQMLLNRGVLDGARLLKPETVDAMSRNQLPPGVTVDLYPAYKFGLGMEVAENPSLPWGFGAIGQYGWGGANGTYFGVDPKEQMITLWMTQGRPQDHPARLEFHNLAYRAIIR
jgi:CubicO group peptidase (beta-lactamase class C family)